MIVQSATEPGDPNIPNEDWVHASKDLLIVIDGATARTETGCIHGVAWYAEQLGKALIAEASELDTRLPEALAAAIAHVASLHPDCDLRHPATPSAAVGVVRLSGKQVEVMVLADVTVVIELNSGDITVITDTRVAASAPSERAKALELPIDHPDRPDALRKMKLAQQERRNRTGGFFVAASEPSAACQAQLQSAPKSDARAVAVFSDGAARAASSFEHTSWRQLMSLLASAGPRAVIEAVRQLEDSDRTARRWPRSKMSDDATVAYAGQPIGH